MDIQMAYCKTNAGRLLATVSVSYPSIYCMDTHVGNFFKANFPDYFSDVLIAELQTPEFVNYIKEHTGPKYGADLELQKKEPQVPVASFRKLNVDWHNNETKLTTRLSNEIPFAERKTAPHFLFY